MPDTADHLRPLRQFLSDKTYSRRDRILIAIAYVDAALDPARRDPVPVAEVAARAVRRIERRHRRGMDETLMAFAGGPDE